MLPTGNPRPPLTVGAKIVVGVISTIGLSLAILLLVWIWSLIVAIWP